jgi:hypothetical protein
LVVSAIVFSVSVTTEGLAQDVVCENARLEAAQARYDLGLFVEVFDLLDPCVPDGFSVREQRVVACRLMALSHIAIDSNDDAREWTRLLLRQEPDYRVVPETDPPRFASMVDDLQPAWYTWLWKGNEWYKWAGRTAIVGTAVAVPLLLRDTPEPDLPLPPAFPSR